MGSSLVVAFSLVLISAAGLHLARRRALACWLMVTFPAISCIAGLVDLSHGPAKLGEAAFESAIEQLGFCAALLLLSVFAALQVKWRWLFWTALACNGVVCGILVYLAFFWKVFR